MVRNGRRLFPWRWNCCLSVCARELCAVRAVPVIVWRRTRQPRFPPRKGAPRVASRTARQSRDCLRVRPLSDPPPLHGAARLAGAFFATVGTGARRFSSRLHSATANPPSSARGNPSAATARLAWSRSLPAPIASVPAASCPSRPCAPSAHVRFCGARSAPLTVSKVSALVRNCAESSPFTLSPCHGSAERAGGAAARGGGGDGGRRGRRQARCRRSGDGRYSDRAGRRQTAPHPHAAPRRNPPEPAVRRTSCRTLAQR